VGIWHCSAGIGIWDWASNDQGSEPGVIDHIPRLATRAVYFKQKMHDKLMEHKAYIVEYGQDLPKIRDRKRGRWTHLQERTSIIFYYGIE